MSSRLSFLPFIFTLPPDLFPLSCFVHFNSIHLKPGRCRRRQHTNLQSYMWTFTHRPHMLVSHGQAPAEVIEHRLGPVLLPFIKVSPWETEMLLLTLLVWHFHGSAVWCWHTQQNRVVKKHRGKHKGSNQKGCRAMSRARGKAVRDKKKAEKNLNGEKEKIHLMENNNKKDCRCEEILKLLVFLVYFQA